MASKEDPAGGTMRAAENIFGAAAIAGGAYAMFGPKDGLSSGAVGAGALIGFGGYAVLRVVNMYKS